MDAKRLGRGKSASLESTSQCWGRTRASCLQRYTRWVWRLGMSWHVYIHFKTQVDKQKDQVQNSKIRKWTVTKKPQQKFPPKHSLCVCLQILLWNLICVVTHEKSLSIYRTWSWSGSRTFPTFRHCNACWTAALSTGSCWSMQPMPAHIIHLHTWFKWMEKYIDGCF